MKGVYGVLIVFEVTGKDDLTYTILGEVRREAKDNMATVSIMFPANSQGYIFDGIIPKDGFAIGDTGEISKHWGYLYAISYPEKENELYRRDAIIMLSTDGSDPLEDGINWLQANTEALNKLLAKERAG